MVATRMVGSSTVFFALALALFVLAVLLAAGALFSPDGLSVDSTSMPAMKECVRVLAPSAVAATGMGHRARFVFFFAQVVEIVSTRTSEKTGFLCRAELRMTGAIQAV